MSRCAWMPGSAHGPRLRVLARFFPPAVKREAPLPPVSPPKAALSEEELEKKSKAIIDEYLHLNDMKVGPGWSELSAAPGSWAVAL